MAAASGCFGVRSFQFILQFQCQCLGVLSLGVTLCVKVHAGSYRVEICSSSQCVEPRAPSHCRVVEPSARRRVKMSCHFGLLVPQQAAGAIQTGDQSHVLMAFQCRQVQKNGRLFLLAVRDEDHAVPAARCDSDHTSGYQVLCELRFISNRRLSDEQVFALGTAQNSLPTNADDLAALREMLGVKDKKDRRVSIAWEIKVDKILDPPIRLAKVSPMVRENVVGSFTSAATHVATDPKDSQDWCVSC